MGWRKWHFSNFPMYSFANSNKSQYTDMPLTSSVFCEQFFITIFASVASYIYLKYIIYRRSAIAELLHFSIQAVALLGAFTTISYHIFAVFVSNVHAVVTTTTVIRMNSRYCSALFFCCVLIVAHADRDNPHLGRCPPGTLSLGQRCELCKPGTYAWFRDADYCFQCPENTFTPYTGVTNLVLCQKCPVDSYSKAGSASCTRCPRGQVRDDAAENAEKKCRPCDGDECQCAKSTEGCKAYSPCPKGYVLPTPGTSYFPDSECVSAISGCPAGFILRSWHFKPLCLDRRGKIYCPENYIFDGVDQCITCDANSYVKYSRFAGRFLCFQCPTYTVSKGGVVRECDPCPKGLVRVNNDTTCYVQDEDPYYKLIRDS